MENKAALFFFFLTSFLSLVAPLNAGSYGVTAVFALGDSTLDPGNNDALGTLFRGDHPPYGRDFPGHIPTGRLTNGKLVTDFLASSLGIKDVLPAYSDPTVTNQGLLTGVSFASAGTGLDDLTATISSVLHMSTQLENFEHYIGRIQGIVGREEAARIISNAIFVIGAGTNDLLFNFYGLPTRRAQYSLSGYQDFLLQNLQSVLERLYGMGARKFAISGLPPIGCLPIQRTTGSFIPGQHMFQRVCVDQQNIDSQYYNSKLQGRINMWQTTFPGSRIAYTDIYSPLMDMATNPWKYGFQQTQQGCCGTGLVEMGSLCGPVTPTCPDPTKFLFWDAVHPTQSAYQVMANVFTSTVIPRLVN